MRCIAFGKNSKRMLLDEIAVTWGASEGAASVRWRPVVHGRDLAEDKMPGNNINLGRLKKTIVCVS